MSMKDDDVIDDESFVILERDSEEMGVEPVDSVMKTKELTNEEIKVNVDNGSGVSSLEEKVYQIMEENTILKERIVQCNKIMRSQHENILALEDCYNQAREDKVLVEIMLKKEKQSQIDELERLKARNNSLENEVDTLKDALDELCQKRHENIRDFKQEIAQLKLEKDNLTKELSQMKITQEALEGEMAGVKQSLRELSHSRDGALKDLDLAKKETEEVQAELMKVKSVNEEKQQSLNKELENARSQFHAAELKFSAGLGAKTEELNATKVMFMQLEQSKFVADGRIDALKTEIFGLNQQLLDREHEMDQVYSLRAQLSVFKTDYEMEKRSKRRLKYDNDLLTEEVQNLRICCQQLQEEVNVLREVEDIAPHYRETPLNDNQEPATEDEPPLKCPICNFQFASPHALENHVQRCLGAAP